MIGIITDQLINFKEDDYIRKKVENFNRNISNVEMILEEQLRNIQSLGNEKHDRMLDWNEDINEDENQ